MYHRCKKEKPLIGLWIVERVKINSLCILSLQFQPTYSIPIKHHSLTSQRATLMTINGIWAFFLSKKVAASSRSGGYKLFKLVPTAATLDHAQTLDIQSFIRQFPSTCQTSLCFIHQFLLKGLALILLRRPSHLFWYGANDKPA